MDKYFQVIISCLFFVFASAFAEIERVSVSTTVQQGNSESIKPSITADGRFVAFQSYAGNLVDGDTNSLLDIFVHDRTSMKTERVSISSTGMQTDHISKNTSISVDGRYVVFESRASNLVAGDTNGWLDIYIRDREMKTTERVSVSTLGVESNAHSYNPLISADGRFVSFNSTASNLVDGDSNNVIDVFVHDRQLKTTNRVSVSSSGEQGNRLSYARSISADGRYLVFSSDASNLVASDTNSQGDIFVHDQELGITQRVSVSSSGEQANKFSSVHHISADGRYVIFNSSASNLVVGDTNGTPDIFVHDRELKKTERVSVSSSGAQARAGSFYPSISVDGRYAAFISTANNLVVGDINGVGDVFVHDLQMQKTARIDSSITGAQINSGSLNSTISADGHFVAFHSNASNLVEADTNQTHDVFVADNPLMNAGDDIIKVEKFINNAVRETPATAAQLLAGTQYRQSYKLTNNSSSRIYQVQVFENAKLVCNFYALNPGQSRQRCDSLQPVLEGNQQVKVTVTAKDSVSAESLISHTDVYYTGHINATGKLQVKHKINNNDADSPDKAQRLNSSQTTVFFKIENIGEIELYRVKAYHDPVSPVNSGWSEQCIIGPLKPGQVRYCKRDILLSELGLNESMGRVQATNAINSATEVINAANPTYFIVP